jgi:hypothetical protein
VYSFYLQTVNKSHLNKGGGGNFPHHIIKVSGSDKIFIFLKKHVILHQNPQAILKRFNKLKPQGSPLCIQQKQIDPRVIVGYLGGAGRTLSNPTRMQPNQRFLENG